MFTPQQRIERRKEQHRRWTRDNKDWYYPKLNSNRRNRYAALKGSGLLLFLVSFGVVCFGQQLEVDLNPAHTKFPEPKLIAPTASVVRVTTNINLTWKPSPDEAESTGYSVLYGTTEGQYNCAIQLGIVTNCTLLNLPSGNEYHFAVLARSRNKGENSDLSGETTLKVPLVLLLMFPDFGSSLESSQNMRNWNLCRATFTNGYWIPVIDTKQQPQLFYRLRL